MHLKSTKKIAFKAVKIANDFSSEILTSYSGLTVVIANVVKQSRVLF
jgi:hypothetical protein